VSTLRRARKNSAPQPRGNVRMRHINHQSRAVRSL
jgi:hypothetical protein